jgi:hypothetical protein
MNGETSQPSVASGFSATLILSTVSASEAIQPTTPKIIEASAYTTPGLTVVFVSANELTGQVSHFCGGFDKLSSGEATVSPKIFTD